MVFFSLSLFAAAPALLQESSVYQTKFGEWQTKFGAVEAHEFEHRLQVFSENEDFIVEQNKKYEAGLSKFTVAHNQFSALNRTEFKDLFLSNPMPAPVSPRNVFTADADSNFADAVDWTTKNAVTPVKNQAHCGSCWSFSTTGSLEGAYAIKNNKLTAFSEEQLVECDNAKGGGKDQGCNGGLMDNAFAWIEKNNGLCTEADYPYTSGAGKVGPCNTTCTVVDGSKPSKWTDVAHDEKSLMAAVAQQPVSIAIEADQQSFQLYASGVLCGMCGTKLDHGVLVVGYGNVAGTDYWKVKNSWDTVWGMQGYVLLERGNPQGGGQCGILQSASFPVL